MRFNRRIRIAERVISDDSEVFIIAEAGVNHNGDMGQARQLIDIAADSGADAVKFQTFRTEHLILTDVDKAPYQKKTTDTAVTQYQMLKQLEMTHRQNEQLADYCLEKGIIFLTTPFEEYSLDSLDSLNLPAYKIASTDLTNLPFLRKVAAKNKPIVLSTGMSYHSEIALALAEIYPVNQDVILLQCTANYPIQDNQANLQVIATFLREFDILVGYSDHTVGIGAGPYAAAMGARVIEKHFTLNKNSPGPDHKASLSPEELQQFVNQIRQAEKYLGSGVKIPTLSEIATRRSLQKSLVALRDIHKGDVFSEDNVAAKRCGGRGISPLYCRQIFGLPAQRDYTKDDILDAP